MLKVCVIACVRVRDEPFFGGISAVNACQALPKLKKVGKVSGGADVKVFPGGSVHWIITNLES